MPVVRWRHAPRRVSATHARLALSRSGTAGSPMRKWLPMIILAMAQFVMVLDSSVMNVAISQIVDDLDATIQGVQTAITLYMQGILGLDAFETGKRLLPLSVAMFV